MWLFYYFNFERNYDILKLFWWTKIQTLIKTKWKISNEALERWTSGFPIVGLGGKGVGPHFHPAIFFETTPPPHQNRCPPLKNEAIHICKTTTVPLKSEVSFQKMIPKKTSEKSETLINTCVSIIKQHWKKIVEITQEYDC